MLNYPDSLTRLKEHGSGFINKIAVYFHVREVLRPFNAGNIYTGKNNVHVCRCGVGQLIRVH